MVISEAEIDANANKALDDQVKVKLSAKESSDTFEIVDYTGQLMTALERKKILNSLFLPYSLRQPLVMICQLHPQIHLRL